MSPRFHSGGFGSFPCALGIVGCVWSIAVRPEVCSGAFGPSTRALGVVGFVQVRSVHSRAHLGSSGWFGCVWSYIAPPRGRWVRSGAFGPFPCALGVLEYVRSIPVLPERRRVHSGAFGPCEHALVVVGFVRVCLLHSCMCALGPWGS